MKSPLARLKQAFLWFEEKPMVIIFVAAGATIAVAFFLASSVGYIHVLKRVYGLHAFSWLIVCLIGEVLAYLGYVFTLRDMAKVDDGEELKLGFSLKAVIAGFGVFTATRSTGGFAVDYWAFRKGGASKRDAVGRVLALGFLEYVMLGIIALAASTTLYFHLDGHASDWATFPSLLIVPVVVVALFITSTKRADRLMRLKRDSGFLKKSLSKTVRGALNVRLLLSSPRQHGLGVIGNALYWAGDIACLWAALEFVGGKQITLAALVLGYSGGYVLTRRALPAGGAGFVEAALTFALVGMGLHFTHALIGVIVYRLFNFWLPIIPALFIMPTIRQLRGRFHEAKQPR
jgi:uncharacterized membrane protein YbhN (UPF0104 family)